ncbi:MAG: hypothetical protein ACK559_34955, partial [bacterium]
IERGVHERRRVRPRVEVGRGLAARRVGRVPQVDGHGPPRDPRRVDRRVERPVAGRDVDPLGRRLWHPTRRRIARLRVLAARAPDGQKHADHPGTSRSKYRISPKRPKPSRATIGADVSTLA